MHPVAWRGVPDELIEERGVPLGADRPGAKALRRRKPAYYQGVDQLAADFPRSRERGEASGMQTFAYLPLWAAGSAIGLAVLGWREPDSLARDDRPFLESVAGQCALALDRARRYETERDIAETLQRSVLPETLPSMEGLRVAAVYLPGSTAVDVGGDWFDTLTLADGRMGFVVGDVVGKGVEAAATMAQLRNGMRALMPGRADARRDRHEAQSPARELYGRPVRDAGLRHARSADAGATVTLAGHPPPLVVEPDGEHPLPGRAAAGCRSAPTRRRPTRSGTRPSSRAPSSCSTRTASSSVPTGRSTKASTCWPRAAGRAPQEPDAFVDAVVEELLGKGPAETTWRCS